MWGPGCIAGIHPIAGNGDGRGRLGSAGGDPQRSRRAALTQHAVPGAHELRHCAAVGADAREGRAQRAEPGEANSSPLQAGAAVVSRCACAVMEHHSLQAHQSHTAVTLHACFARPDVTAAWRAVWSQQHA